MNRLLRAIADHPWRVLGLALVVSLLALPGVFDFATGEPRLRYDPSTNQLLPRSGDASVSYRRARKFFGNDETVIVGLEADDVFAPDPLGSLWRISKRLAALPGVHHVRSLATAPVPRGDGDELRLSPLLERLPESDAERAALRAAALAEPLVAGSLVARDGRMSVIELHFVDFSDREFFTRRFDPEIARIAHEEARGVTVRISGTPWVKRAEAGVMLGAVRERLPYVLAALVGLLWLLFRTSRGVLAPLVTISLALLWTFAVVGYLDRPLNAVTITVPLLLAILGLVYAAHVISAYYDELRDWPAREPPALMARALRRTWLPLLLAALTTAISLLAALATSVRAVREFSLLALLGILVAFTAAVTVTPALLLAFGRPRRFRDRGRAPLPPDRFARFAARTARGVVRHRRAVIALFAVVFLAALAAGSRVLVSTDAVHSLHPGAPARADFDALNAALDGATTLRILVDTGARGGFADPEHLRALAELERAVAADPGVGGTRSLAGWLARLNGVANDVAPALPTEHALATQLLLIGHGDEQAGLVDPAWRRANLVVYTRHSATADLRALRHRLEATLDAIPRPLHARVTGQAVVFQRLWDDIIKRQVQAVALSLAVVYAILSLLFLSPRAGLRALAPNILPVACYFGVLGAFGVPLNVATSFVAPMMLGFALNDTLHYFVRFAVEARRLADEEAATVRTLATVGRPMTYTTIAICAAFLLLTGSELENLRWVGATTAITLALAWLCDFTLTPALCVGLRVVTLWDTLTLDLGVAPQRSIPLLQGLSTAQCRIVAQLASLRSVPGGEPLLRSGTEGREMFLVIDGLLEARLETDGGYELLRRFRRGDIVGEVGFYTRKHTAELFVVERARLLRLTEKTFERLNRRAPGVAAILYRNLSRIMAGRLADTTERLR